MLRKDSADNYTSAIPFDNLPNYVAACKFDSLRGKRIGVPRNVLGAPTDTSTPILEAFEASIAIVKAAGAIIVENTNYTAYQAFRATNSTTVILGADIINNLKKYLDQLVLNPNNVHTLADVSKFTHRFPQEDYPDRITAR
ncbi:hypothetical protein OEA41_004204 [Lepraria neglecta]|uniref:Amidase domain-containing protein n=1 Tax=Lepraria neglecta TaxID=209136 RepID=A0AAE0DJI7_9LECA|nr:hypothetical protein OEA41_004204 [Lepraria neglecta]